MMQKQYVDAQDVALAFGVSKGKAYEIIRELNAQLKKNGYITVSGRCPKKYFEEKYYGYNDHEEKPISKSIEE